MEELLFEWDIEKNGEYSSKIHKVKNKFWWACKENLQHKWQARIDSRKLGTGCPKCRRKKQETPSLEDSLGFTNPEIAKEIFDKSVDPFNIYKSSNKTMLWQCRSNIEHVWNSVVKNRVQGKGCPYCSGRVVLPKDSLGSKFPKIANQIYDKNIDCFLLCVQSNKNIEWKCKSGHIWMARIYDRTNGRGCPKCSNSKSYSKAEEQIFNLLKNTFPKEEIVWNKPLSGKKRYRPDILIESKKIIIEYNGDYWHCNPKKYKPNYYHKRIKKTAQEIWLKDQQKSNFFKLLGYDVIVIWESDWNKLSEDNLLNLIRGKDA